MSDYNKLTVVGGVIESKKGTFPSGGEFVKIRVGLKIPFGDKQQQYYTVIVSGHFLRNADALVGYLSKGRKILIEGTLVFKEWTTPEGVTKHETQIYASQLPIFLDARPAG